MILFSIIHIYSVNTMLVYIYFMIIPSFNITTTKHVPPLNSRLPKFVFVVSFPPLLLPTMPL